MILKKKKKIANDIMGLVNGFLQVMIRNLYYYKMSLDDDLCFLFFSYSIGQILILEEKKKKKFDLLSILF